jgi:hypothetical protein
MPNTSARAQILVRVAQLGRLVDAILAADVGEEPEPSEPAAPAKLSGFSGSVQRRIKEVQSRTTEKSGDLRQWVLQPFVDLRDRVRQLPSLTEQLAHEVALLEILLDLEIVELRVCQGEIPPAEARIVHLRVVPYPSPTSCTRRRRPTTGSTGSPTAQTRTGSPGTPTG